MELTEDQKAEADYWTNRLSSSKIIQALEQHWAETGEPSPLSYKHAHLYGQLPGVAEHGSLVPGWRHQLKVPRTRPDEDIGRKRRQLEDAGHEYETNQRVHACLLYTSPSPRDS